MPQKTIIIISLALAVIIGFMALNFKDNDMLGASQINSFVSGAVTATTTTLSLKVGDYNDVILNANGARKYVEITNVGGTIAYLAYINSTATTSAALAAIAPANFVIPLAASGGKYVINLDNLYRGRILATSTAAVEIRALEVQ